MRLVDLPIKLALVLAVARTSAPHVYDTPPTPLQRALAALQGLMGHFVQTESNVKPIPRPKNCPCFSCGGKNCTHPTCGFCSVFADANCVTKTSPGCYTTAEEACYCNLPDINPQPADAGKLAMFFFSCGQIGGMGPSGKVGDVGDGICQCESDWTFGCTNCYRWWSAVALEASVNYCIHAELAWNSSGICGVVFQAAQSMWAHSPYNEYWDGSISAVYVDDFVWYALAYIKMFEWTGSKVWQERSRGLHDWTWRFGWDQRPTNESGEIRQCGGFWWSLWDRWPYKDSITIVEMLHSAAKLASIYDEGSDNRTLLTQKAIKIWSWIFAFDDGRGLLAANGIMSTGAVPEWCCAVGVEAIGSNFTRPGPPCSNSRAPGMSYNHGLLMSSAALLYNLTADKDYLTIGLQLLDSAYENLTNDAGAVRDAQRGSRVFSPPGAGSCQCGHDPGSDFFSFSGIFAAHLMYFADTLQKSKALPSLAGEKILSILRKSSDNAWLRSAAWPPFNASQDLCSAFGNTDGKRSFSDDAKAAVNSSFPKFHWWWTDGNAAIETPPDGGLWFARKGLNCSYYDNALNPVLWSGRADYADACKKLCAGNSSCAKYVFNLDSMEQRVGSANSIYNSSTCECFTCPGKECSYPVCDYCGTLTKHSCLKKNSSGCYTKATAGCSCPSKPDLQQSRPNCWLFQPVLKNRADSGGCNKLSSQFVVGAKRPPVPSVNSPWTTCRNRCNISATTGKMDINRADIYNKSDVCFCDRSCALHLDCCLDFVELCTPKEEQHPTCKGHCVMLDEASLREQEPLAIPIQGGGYCYCDTKCGNVFTDNNSYGGCCGDYMYLCAGYTKDPICFDARAQGSALHLFAAHHFAEKNLGDQLVSKTYQKSH